MVPNRVARDKTLSFRARGLLAYMLACPPGWEFNSTNLAREAAEGRDAVRSALRELTDAGYYRTRRKRVDGGQIESRNEFTSTPWCWSMTDAPGGDTAQDPPAGDDLGDASTGDGFPGPGFPGAGFPGPLVKTVSKDSQLKDQVVTSDLPDSSARVGTVDNRDVDERTSDMLRDPENPREELPRPARPARPPRREPDRRTPEQRKTDAASLLDRHPLGAAAREDTRRSMAPRKPSLGELDLAASALLADPAWLLEQGVAA